MADADCGLAWSKHIQENTLEMDILAIECGSHSAKRTACLKGIN
jgi:hypothetical protein